MSLRSRAIVIVHVAVTIAAVLVVAHGTDWDRPWAPPEASRPYAFDLRARVLPPPPSLRSACMPRWPLQAAARSGHGLESALYLAAFSAETKGQQPESMIVARTALPFEGFMPKDGRFNGLPAAIQSAIARGSSDCSMINRSELPSLVQFRDVIGFLDLPALAHQVGLTFSVPLVSGRDAVVVDSHFRVGYSGGSFLWFRMNRDRTGWTLVRSIVWWET